MQRNDKPATKLDAVGVPASGGRGKISLESVPVRRGIDLSDRDTVSQVMREMGRRGGIKGAAALNAKLTPRQRSLSARRAARARWSKPQP